MTAQHPEQDQTTIVDMIAAARPTAIHLETRRVHPGRARVRRLGGGQDDRRAGSWGDWFDVVKAATGRGVEIRRARIVSEPITNFVRYEYDLTAELNLAGGEQVCWLPRRQAPAFLVPLADFWVVDGQAVRFSHFAGDGRYLADEVSRDRAVAQACTATFEAVWELGTPHEEYRPA
ncbi:DUF6879 family protein [Nonomuraea sp. NPDC059023]|uniref:DUF6879 family protein n=1 Tax=unclassified Nonomuraea TaxID=2593643 RepID=UPI0036D0F50B